MRKILSIFTAMLCAIAVNAVPVVLPATLDVNNVSFRSEGMPDFVIEEGQDYAGTYFDMGAHDSSNDTLLYAEWDVTIQPIKYNVAVDVYNTNGWTVQLDLLNQSDEVVKAIRYKGSSGKSGQFAVGIMDLSDLAAGDYKLRARAATAWSQMKLKDLIFTANYSGTQVALPGTLLPIYAELSSGASVANDAIVFNPGTANTEYATWNVNFAAAGTYNVTIDMTASNGHTYGVALLNGETEVGTVAEAQSWDTGVKELGAIEVPAAGSYVVKLTNATQWSEAVLNSITFAGEVAPAEPLMKTIYCKMDKAWWKADGAAVGIYALGDNSAQLAAWPGVRMAPVEGEADLWSFELDINTYHTCVFSRVNGEGDVVDWGAKTSDLLIPTDENDMYTITSETAVWGDPGCTGAWSKYEPSAPVADEWAEIKFVAAAAADEIDADASFTVDGFTVAITDPDNKMSIDANNCRFGSAADYKMYSHRLKSGGKSTSTKNFITLTIPEAGTLRIAVRTGSNSATDRNLVLKQGDDTLYNQVIVETMAVKVMEGETEVSVYPFVEVPVEAGTVALSYPVNGLNFYAFAFKAAGGVTPEPTHTYTVAGGSDVAFGTAWAPSNTANDMTLVEGLYTWEKTELELAAGVIEFKVCEDHAWTTAYPAQNYQLNIQEAGIYTITITFNADTKEVNAVATKTGSAVVIPTIAMHGNFLGSWADTENFAVAEGDATASLTLHIAAGNYEFGMRIGGSGNWTSNGVAFTRENNAAEVVAGQGNLTLAADIAGDYIFTWTFETNTLTITFPIGAGIDNTAVDAQIIKTIENGQLIIIKNGVKYDVHGTIIR